MSKGKGKILGAVITAGIFAAGGLAGGIALATSQTDQKVAEAEDKGYEAGHKDGYEEGLTVNVGYTDDDLENAKEEAFQEGVNSVQNSNVLDISDFGLTTFTSSKLEDGSYLISSTTEGKEGIYLVNKEGGQKLYDGSYSFYSSLSNGDRLLLSKDTSCPGLLYYNHVQNRMTKIFDYGNIFDEILINDDLLLISCKDTMELFSYSIMNNTLIKIAEDCKLAPLMNGSKQISDKFVVVDCDVGFCLYNIETNEMYKLNDEMTSSVSTGDVSSMFLGNKFLYYQISGDNGGIYVHDINTKTSTKIFDISLNDKFELSQPFSDGNILIASETAKTTGIYLYNAKDNSIEQIYQSGSFWYFVPLGDDSTIIYSTNYGLLIYNNNEKSLNVLDDHSALHKKVQDDDVFFSNGYSIYKIKDDTLIQVYNSDTDLLSMSNMFKFSNGDYMFTFGNNGILLYQADLEKCIKLTEDSYSFFYQLKNGDILMSSKSLPGVYLYTHDDNTIKQIYTENYKYNYFVELSNGNVLISSSYVEGLLLYQYGAKSIVSLYDKGLMWNNATILSNGDCILLSTLSSNSYTKGIILFYSDSNTINHFSSGDFAKVILANGSIEFVGENGITYQYNNELRDLFVKSINLS